MPANSQRRPLTVDGRSQPAAGNDIASLDHGGSGGGGLDPLDFKIFQRQ